MCIIVVMPVKLPTNSYMAQPIMFSATMTGPEIEKIRPVCFSPPSVLDLDGAILIVFTAKCR